jgi:hypothetical protein
MKRSKYSQNFTINRNANAVRKSTMFCKYETESHVCGACYRRLKAFGKPDTGVLFEDFLKI